MNVYLVSIGYPEINIPHAVFSHRQDAEAECDKLRLSGDPKATLLIEELPADPGTKSRYICVDCKQEPDFVFMLKNEVWIRVARFDEILCLKCFEKRNGKPITFDDLKPCGITRAMQHAVKMGKENGKA